MISPLPLLRNASIREVEARYVDAHPPLMERAGTAIAHQVAELAGAHTGPILVLAGPGNNGGDALVATTQLEQQGYDVTLVRAGEPIPQRDWLLVVDGLFGIGLTRPVEGTYAAIIEQVNGLSCPVLAIDIPSGLCADTGRVLGTAIRATHTITFIAGKPGLYTLDGPDHCGSIFIESLGVSITGSEGFLISPALFTKQLKPRRQNTHKGDFGNVAIVGGAPGMAGAALLAGRAALNLGAGRVHVGMLERLPVDPSQPELMLRPAADVLELGSVLAVGPGLGQSGAALDLLQRAIEAPLPLILDADALNLLAVHPVLQKKVSRRGTPTLLTPHPAEAARLLDKATADVQTDRIEAALELARRHHATVVLKGCGTIVASVDGSWFVNATGNAGLATAGSGDVLTGAIAALLAQHWPPIDAAMAAVHLLGAAADELAAEGCGPSGMTAGEAIAPARRIFNRWLTRA